MFSFILGMREIINQVCAVGTGAPMRCLPGKHFFNVSSSIPIMFILKHFFNVFSSTPKMLIWKHSFNAPAPMHPKCSFEPLSGTEKFPLILESYIVHFFRKTSKTIIIIMAKNQQYLFWIEKDPTPFPLWNSSENSSDLVAWPVPHKHELNWVGEGPL